MNGHCHSYDINPNLTYSGWLVSIGNGKETHWHYTVHESLLFIEELLLGIELWKALDCLDPLIIHHHDSGFRRPYLTLPERQKLIEGLEDFFGWKLPKRLQRCIHMFLLKNQNRQDFQIRWANFVSQMEECRTLSPELITTHILLLEWGVSQ